MHTSSRLLSVVLVALALLSPGGTVSAAQRLSENAAWGRSIAGWRCSPCHAVSGEPASANPRAPRFVDLAQRFTVVGLERRLTGFAGDHPDVMPPRDLTTDQALFVAAYIASLRTASPKPRP